MAARPRRGKTGRERTGHPHPDAAKNRAKGRALREGYREKTRDFTEQLLSWGIPKDFLPAVQELTTNPVFTLMPKDEQAAESYLRQVHRANAPLRTLAMLRGLIGYPTAAPPQACPDCSGSGIAASTASDQKVLTKRDNCPRCAGDGKVSEVYLKPDAKVVQVADERAHGKPMQPVQHSIDEGTRDLIERVLTADRTPIRIIPTSAKLLEDGDN
jgi:hypothetical protein